VRPAEGLPREDARGSAEETRPSAGRALGHPAHPSTIHAPVLPPSGGGLPQPQQEEKEFGSGTRTELYYRDYMFSLQMPLSVKHCHVHLPGQVSHPGLQRFPGQSLLSQHQSSVHHLPPKAAFWNPLHKNNPPWQPQTSDRKNPQSQECQLRPVRTCSFITYMALEARGQYVPLDPNQWQHCYWIEWYHKDVLILLAV